MVLSPRIHVAFIVCLWGEVTDACIRYFVPDAKSFMGERVTDCVRRDAPDTKIQER